jgi:hypothetical protein
LNSLKFINQSINQSINNIPKSSRLDS